MDEAIKSVDQKENLGSGSCGRNEDHELHRNNIPKTNWLCWKCMLEYLELFKFI